LKLCAYTVAEIKKLIEQGETLSEEFLAALKNDGRAGVRRLYRQWQKQQKMLQEEMLRLEGLYRFEEKLYKMGFNCVAGVDEAGRGPLAGPVFAAAVILPRRARLPGLNDSKKISPQKREKLFTEIKRIARAWAMGVATVKEIDELNIYHAALLAMRRAVHRLKKKPDYVLVDGFAVPGLPVRQMPLVGGDGLSASIAAASILAKVGRDRVMDVYHRRFPQYGFDRNRGYPTRQHLNALERFGPCSIHRQNFEPIKQLLRKGIYRKLVLPH